MFSHLGVLGAHDPGDHEAPLLVGDYQHLFVEPAEGTVEERDLLSPSRTPHDNALPHLRRVEGVYGLAGLQHDVVGGVDDGVDGPHAAGVYATPHPHRRLLSGCELRDAPQVVPWAEVFIVHPQPEVGRQLAPRLRGELRDPVVGPEDGGELSGDPDHAPQVRPVGRDVDVEHGLTDREVVRDGTPDHVLFVEQEDAIMIRGNAELAFAHHHPIGLQAPQLGLPQLRPIGQDASRQHDGHAGTGVGVRGAGDDLRLVAAEIDLRHEEPVRVGVGTELHDLPHDDLTVGDPVTVDAVYFLAVQGEKVDQL
jgi:hypothetical protein